MSSGTATTLFSSKSKQTVSDSGIELSKVLVSSKKELGNVEGDLVTKPEDRGWSRIFKKMNKKKAKKQTNPSTEWKGQSQKSSK
ncbi:hypothetical protein Tco_0326308 [Tanacetum coccineum]